MSDVDPTPRYPILTFGPARPELLRALLEERQRRHAGRGSSRSTAITPPNDARPTGSSLQTTRLSKRPPAASLSEPRKA